MNVLLLHYFDSRGDWKQIQIRNISMNSYFEYHSNWLVIPYSFLFFSLRGKIISKEGRDHLDLNMIIYDEWFISSYKINQILSIIPYILEDPNFKIQLIYGNCFPNRMLQLFFFLFAYGRGSFCKFLLLHTKSRILL